MCNNVTFHCRCCEAVAVEVRRGKSKGPALSLEEAPNRKFTTDAVSRKDSLSQRRSRSAREVDEVIDFMGHDETEDETGMPSWMGSTDFRFRYGAGWRMYCPVSWKIVKKMQWCMSIKSSMMIA